MYLQQRLPMGLSKPKQAVNRHQLYLAQPLPSLPRQKQHMRKTPKTLTGSAPGALTFTVSSCAETAHQHQLPCPSPDQLSAFIREQPAGAHLVHCMGLSAAAVPGQPRP